MSDAEVSISKCKIIKSSKEKGMNAIVHTGWYIMSILNIAEGKFDIAYGVLNNSTIQMEKTGGISEYLTMLHKVNMYKVLMCTQAKDKAEICLNQATDIVQKYELNFNLNVDIRELMSENSNRYVQPVNNPLHSPVEENESIREPVENDSDVDGEVVNPEDFFSDN